MFLFIVNDYFFIYLYNGLWFIYVKIYVEKF
jgi:hypothetical protein